MRAPPRPLHVLLVEDNTGMRDAVAAFLRRAGHQVEVASEGREGLAAFQAGLFDIVVTDHDMPEMSGATLAAAVKREAPATPVVMATGNPDVVAGRRLPAGVDILLPKPFGPEELGSAFARLGLKAGLS